LRTTAHHPQANGMVERFHRQLKSSLKYHETENWTEILPIVLLGIRTALKEDMNALFSELLFGSGIRLPGDFFTTNTFSAYDSDFVNNYKQNVSKIQPAHAILHGMRKSFIFKELFTSPFVFVRRDSAKGPLRPPYDGPFTDKSRNNKYMSIIINNKDTSISIDRLKPSFVLLEENNKESTVIHTSPSDSRNSYEPF
jgi:hypothetical protein